MAKSLHKKNRITIRFADGQFRKLLKAVQLECDRRGENVDESALARELIMVGVDRILASAEPAQLTA